jgi:gluconokinase
MAPDDRTLPPAEVVIGIDVGTTAAKVSAFGVGSPWRHTVVREYPLLRPNPGWEVQQPDVLAAAMLAALTDTVSACRGSRVLALALSSAMHGLIGLDAARQPLTPLITWADSRAGDVAAELRSAGLAAELHRRSGTPVHSMSPLTKILWFRRQEPELFHRVRTWTGLKGWMVWTLTGTLATELSSASGTGLLDLSTGAWSPQSMALAGIDLEQLPPVLGTTDVLGLSKAVARRVGLPTATSVVLGAGDGPLGNLGTGALGDGVAAVSIGTSGAVRAVTPRPHVDDRGSLFCYALTRQAWVVGGAVSNGGSVQRWAGEVFGAQGAGGSQRPDDEAVLALAASIPAGSDGLVALPFLMAERAPLWDPTIPGAFLGLRNLHTRGHFVRACVEGVAIQLSAVLTQLEAVVPVTSIRATGGVFRSQLWRSIVADVLNLPVTVTDGAEGSALGAAALGLIGLGRAESLESAVDLLRTIGEDDEQATVPDPARADVYDRVRERIPALLAGYRSLAELFAAAGPDSRLS